MGLLSLLMRTWTMRKRPPIKSIDWVTVLATLVPHVAMGIRKAADEVAGSTISDESMPRLTNELYFLYLHILDRKAFDELDSRRREAFITPVVLAVANRIALERFPSDYLRAFHEFIDLFGNRSGIYGDCRWVAARDEVLAGTLLWEARCFVSGAAARDDDAARDPMLMLAVYAVISGHALAFVKSFLGTRGLS